MTTPKITTVKPDGDDGARYYVFEGSDKPIPGVTSVLGAYSPGGGESLIQWAAREAAEYAVQGVRSDEPTYDYGGHRLTYTGLCKVAPKQAFELTRDARKRMRDVAAGRGNDAHDTIERVAFMSPDELRAAYASVPDEADPFDAPYCKWALASWGKFVTKYNVRVIHSEVTIYSRNGHMGTCDLIVEMDTPWLDKPRGVVILDTKTGKVYGKVSLQLAAYRFGDYIISDDNGKVTYTELPEIDGAAVYRPKEHEDKPYDLIPVRADESDYRVFLAALTLFEWEKGSGRESQALGKAVEGKKSNDSKPPIDWGTHDESDVFA